jgi:peroxiredoxin
MTLEHATACASGERERNDKPDSALADYAQDVGHLLDRSLPPVVLESFLTGKETPLRVVVRGACAVYFYPGSTTVEPASRSSEDNLQHRGFRDHREELAADRVAVVGISSEPRSLQGRVYLDLGIEHQLLSDPKLKVAKQLGLPTFCVGGRRFYSRLTLLTGADGTIEHVFYPVSEPGEDSVRVCAWVREHRGLS